MVSARPFQSPERPPKQYLPAAICAQLSELDEIAEYFCDRVNTATNEGDCGGYQITDTKEWDAFETSVFRIGERREKTKKDNQPYDVGWCKDHTRLLQETQKLSRLPDINKNGDFLMAGEYVLPADDIMPEIAHIYQSLTKLTIQITDALNSAGLTRAPRQRPTP